MNTKPDDPDATEDAALPSGERSHVDGSTGVDNRIDGEEVPVPPDTLTPEQERQRQHDKRLPEQRKTPIV